MARATLKQSPGKGTLVDTWYYDATYATEAGGGEGEATSRRQTRKVAVELRLVKEFAGSSESPPYATGAVRFAVTCKEVGLRLEGTDIEALRAAMWEHLDARYRIAWERWLLVKVDRQGPFHGRGTGFTFSYEEVERGVAFDGSALLREYQTYGERGFKVRAWPDQFKERNGRTRACIPATPENVAALEEFERKIDDMRRKLAAFVAPDAIQAFLANLRDGMERAGEARLLAPGTGVATGDAVGDSAEPTRTDEPG